MEMDQERKARPEKMIATSTAHMLDLIKGVVDVGVVLSLKQSWQLYLSFKLDVQAPTTERNIDHELLSASLIIYIT